MRSFESIRNQDCTNGTPGVDRTLGLPAGIEVSLSDISRRFESTPECHRFLERNWVRSNSTRGWPTQDRCGSPVEEDREKAKYERNRDCGDGGWDDGNAEELGQHGKSGHAEDRRNNKELTRFEHEWFFAHEDIADQTTAHGIHHSDENAGRERQARFKSFARTDHSVGARGPSINNKNWIG